MCGSVAQIQQSHADMTAPPTAPVERTNLDEERLALYCGRRPLQRDSAEELGVCLTTTSS